jgi:uncharacterized membrane protein required for colicin V production
MKEKSLSQRLNDLFEKIKDYFQLRLDYFTLAAGEHVVSMLSRLIIIVLIFCLAFFITLFLAGALVAWVGTITGDWPLAMLTGAGVFLVLGLLIYLLRIPLITTPLNKTFLKMIDHKKNDENHG